MADLYQDQVQKIAYYRARIIQELAQKGIYPDDHRVSARLNEIDSRLGIFQYIPVGVADLFDAAKFNEDMVRIAQDLKILYQLAYDISVQEYNELKVYCETRLSQLQAMATRYQYKSQFELDSTYLGKTILYQSTGFNAEIQDGICTVKLGTISVEQQSKLVCMFESDAVTPDHVIFTLTDSFGGTLSCSPYSYNKDMLTVPGKLKVKTYTFKNENLGVRTMFICTPSGLEVNADNRYMVYGGKGFVQQGYYQKTYTEKLTGMPVTIEGGGVATFYVLDADYINFEFSEEPKNKNFEGYTLQSLPHCQKIIIEHPNTLSFNFTTNGTIYATCHEAKIKDNNIYYPVPEQVGDIFVEEYSVGDKVNYTLNVTAGTFTDGNIPDIKTIAVKQISILEEFE